MGLKEMRRALNITQQEMADYVGVTQSYICALENGQRKNPSIGVIERVAQKLGVGVEKIITEIRKAG
jgi:transcriptional regulator with XRE-family HTH domain